LRGPTKPSVEAARFVEHREDAPAIEAAKQLLDGSNIVEVWEGARVVMRLDSTIAEKRPQPRIAC
jgi:hypothetical protein